MLSTCSCAHELALYHRNPSKTFKTPPSIGRFLFALSPPSRRKIHTYALGVSHPSPWPTTALYSSSHPHSLDCPPPISHPQLHPPKAHAPNPHSRPQNGPRIHLARVPREVTKSRVHIRLPRYMGACCSFLAFVCARLRRGRTIPEAVMGGKRPAAYDARRRRTFGDAALILADSLKQVCHI